MSQGSMASATLACDSQNEKIKERVWYIKNLFFTKFNYHLYVTYSTNR